jgi:hypothetical protein
MDEFSFQFRFPPFEKKLQRRLKSFIEKSAIITGDTDFYGTKLHPTSFSDRAVV